MQKDITEKKNLIKRALAATMRECRGEQSLFKYSSENDIPLSIVSEAERGLKDPQLTTIFKMEEAYYLSPGTFVDKIASKLPPKFSMIDK